MKKNEEDGKIKIFRLSGHIVPLFYLPRFFFLLEHFFFLVAAPKYPFFIV